MATAALNTADRFRIGRVFHDSFAVIGRNPVQCIGMALIFSGLPQFAIQFLVLKGFISSEPYSRDRLWFAVLSGLAIMLFAALLQTALVRVAVEDLNGKRPALGDCLRTAFSVLLPTIAIALLATFGAAFAALLLVVPGVILFLRWSIAIPALVQERLGVFASMARSSDLTKGSRWPLLGLWGIILVAAFLIQMALELTASTEAPILAILLDAVATAIMYMVTSIAPAVCYIELRRVKEGASVEELAEIFS